MYSGKVAPSSKVVVFTLMALASSAAICADNSLVVPVKKSIANSVSAEANKARWEQEPTAFIGIKLDQPVAVSALSDCPTKTEKLINTLVQSLDVDAVQQSNVMCVNRAPNTKELSYIPIEGIKISPLQSTAMLMTVDNTNAGKIGEVRTTFRSDDFEKVAEMFTIKYGKPHQVSSERVKTRWGTELENVEMLWSGVNVSIRLSSFSPEATGTGWWNKGQSVPKSTGLISVSTTDYLQRVADEQRNVLLKQASLL